MNDLITNNLNLVPFVIKKMNIFDMSDYEDYYQVGVIGLIYASKKYNKDLKISFFTFAYVILLKPCLNWCGFFTFTDVKIWFCACSEPLFLHCAV